MENSAWRKNADAVHIVGQHKNKIGRRWLFWKNAADDFLQFLSISKRSDMDDDTRNRSGNRAGADLEFMGNLLIELTSCRPGRGILFLKQ